MTCFALLYFSGQERWLRLSIFANLSELMLRVSQASSQVALLSLYPEAAKLLGIPVSRTKTMRSEEIGA